MIDRYGNKYWCIKIGSNGKKYTKAFKQIKFSLEEVVEIRDKMLKELHGEFCNLE